MGRVQGERRWMTAIGLEDVESRSILDGRGLEELPLNEVLLRTVAFLVVCGARNSYRVSMSCILERGVEIWSIESSWAEFFPIGDRRAIAPDQVEDSVC